MLCHSGMLSCNEKVDVDINTGIMKSMMKSSELAELSHSAQCLQTGPCLLGIPLSPFGAYVSGIWEEQKG